MEHNNRVLTGASPEQVAEGLKEHMHLARGEKLPELMWDAIVGLHELEDLREKMAGRIGDGVTIDHTITDAQATAIARLVECVKLCNAQADAGVMWSQVILGFDDEAATGIVRHALAVAVLFPANTAE